MEEGGSMSTEATEEKLPAGKVLAGIVADVYREAA